MEGHVGFGLGPRCVQEGRAEYVHPLHVDAGLGAPGFGGTAAAVSGGQCPSAAAGTLLHVLLDWVCVLEFGAAEIRGGVGQSSGFGERGGLLLLLLSLLLRIMQGPCYSIEEADERIVGYAAFEERVGFEGAESVVADFGVGWRGAAPGKGEVGVGWDWGGVEQDEPDIDAEV